MSLKLSSIKADLAKEAEGDWVSIPEWPGVRLKARSINSRDFQIAREMLVQKLTRQLGRLPTSPEMEPALAKLVAIHLARGWEGLLAEDEKTEEVYSPQRALELIGDPTMRELEMQYIWCATRVGATDAEFTADTIKNSAAPSATN